jgi:hypothetical protein
MSGRIVGEVLNHAPEDLPRLDLLVLVALAEIAHDKDRTARTDCSDAVLAYKARSTPASVRQALKRLKDRALIRPVHARVYRGQQQNWTITKLSSYHREGANIIPLKRDPHVTQSEQGMRDPHVTHNRPPNA